MKIRVYLNGTNENPYHRFGTTQNPFPQIASKELQGHMLHLQKLGGDPIPNTDYIREHLKGWSQEFVDGLCERFKPGIMVIIDVTIPEEVFRRN